MLTLTKHQQRIAWRPPTPLPAGVTPHEVYVGQGEQQFAAQVAIVHLSRPLSRDEWQQVRKARNMMHVVIVGQLADHLYLFGPGLDQAPIGPVSTESVQRILDDALGNDDFVIMAQQLHQNLEALRSNRREFVGINNNGLFANHELYHGVPQRPDWRDACTKAQAWLPARGINLIEALGYTTSTQGANALLMSNHAGQSQAVAILLQNDEDFDGTSVRIGVSPVAHGLAVAQRMQVPWVMLLRDATIRLYPANPDYGTGRRGLAETYCELNLSVLDQAQAGYLALIFAAEALSATGSIYSILANSNQYAVALGKRLREKVYSTIVPTLAVAVANECARVGMTLDRAGLDRAYQITLRIFFRLLFQAYAEDRRLLPYGSNQQFDAHSLNQFAQRLLSNAVPDHDAHSTTLWDSLHAVWRAIDAGNPEWDIPAYNGGLFGSHPQHHPDGYLISQISLPDYVLTPVLSALLLDSDDTQTLGAIDFRSLSVREFGTIYEGLLESNLGIAEYDLTLDANDTWVPARAGEPIQAPRGSVYFHNTSGQRKGTGSYFTPAFVVEHLIERALIPALDRHLADIKAMMVAGQTRSAGERFFDFRVADLAMGSGHFLTAAIDHIENRMAAFLAETPIDRVSQELAELTAAAQEALPHMRFEIERSALLRRQIARRCIYGLDINPIAVELARVSIWIHTFVRGLPMSSLDHNLVCANALTGIGTIDEALDVLLPKRRAGQVDMMETAIRAALDQARMTMVGVNASTEATIDQTRQVSADIRRAQTQARQAKLLFDAAVLMRIGQRQLVNGADPDDIAEQAGQATAQAALAHLAPAHMPVLFPEVFLRENGGFDVLLGNPPWEKVKVEEHVWWGLRNPGLRSLPMVQMTRRINELQQSRPDLLVQYETDVNVAKTYRDVINKGPYPGIGSGDIDLYKAFAWRNIHLLRTYGQTGIVMPRGAITGSGTAIWRQEILEHAQFSDVITITNTRNWVFQGVDGRYQISFICIHKNPDSSTVHFAGPFTSYEEFKHGRNHLFVVDKREFTTWTGTNAFPLIPDQLAGEIFRQMKTHPEFSTDDTFLFRPNRELDATNDRRYFTTGQITQSPNDIPVLTGSSFNIWAPDSGDYYGIAHDAAAEYIFTKVQNSSRQARSAFYNQSINSVNDLPFKQARIAFRDVTNSTNTRTCIVCLIPPDVLLVHKAPYLVRQHGQLTDDAFLLGIMSSIPFDWYIRRLVELSLSFEILNSTPIPRPHPDDPRRQRVVEIAGRLAAVDARYQAWADAVGVPVGSVTSATLKDDLIAELDALVAHLYGLNRAQLSHVFATFHRGWAYQERLARVLYFYDQLLGAHA